MRPTASAAAESAPGDILISNRRPVWVYVKEAVVQFKRNQLEQIQLKASGMALAHAVAVAEDIRRAVGGLHQVASFSKRTVTDVYEPTKSGLENITRERLLPTIDIVLSKRALRTSEPGYQSPLPDSQVKEMTLEEAEKGLSSS
jgi:DNA-binding protein